MARRARARSSASPASPTPFPGGRSEQDYAAEDDFRTMERAEEVRSDPARHRRAIGHGRKRIGAMQRIVGGTARGKARGKAPSRARMRGR